MLVREIFYKFYLNLVMTSIKTAETQARGRKEKNMFVLSYMHCRSLAFFISKCAIHSVWFSRFFFFFFYPLLVSVVFIMSPLNLNKIYRNVLILVWLTFYGIYNFKDN